MLRYKSTASKRHTRHGEFSNAELARHDKLVFCDSCVAVQLTCPERVMLATKAARTRRRKNIDDRFQKENAGILQQLRGLRSTKGCCQRRISHAQLNRRESRSGGWSGIVPINVAYLRRVEFSLRIEISRTFWLT